MFVTRIKMLNKNEPYLNYEEANAFQAGIISDSDRQAVVYFKTDAMLDGIIHPVEYEAYDRDTNTVVWEFYHDTLDQLKAFRQKIAETDVWQRSGDLMLQLGWELEFDIDDVDAFPETARVINLAYNLHLVRPERRDELADK